MGKKENAGKTGGGGVTGRLALFGTIAAVIIYPKALVAVAVFVVAAAVIGVKND